MSLARAGIIVASALWLASAVSLRIPVPKGLSKEDKARFAVAVRREREQASEVIALRAKLEQIDMDLIARLAPNGALANSGISAPLQAFVHELNQTLKDTININNATDALFKLRNAKSGVQSLMKDMTVRQMELMKEDSCQATNLLLGVLMSRQKEEMKKQMEVLKSPDFAKLPCVIAVLKNKDTTTPLFKQVAKFLDEHPEHHSAAETSSSHKAKAPDMSSIIQALEMRVHKIEDNNKRRVALNSQEMTNFNKAEVNATSHRNTKLEHRLEHLQKKEERKFKMEEAVSSKDLASLKDAVDAIKHGDMKKLAHAQGALEDSMKRMQAHGNGFMVFIQQAHRLSGLDCPFCVAQCIEKCSSGGNTYTTCLTQCADAGSE